MRNRKHAAKSVLLFLSSESANHLSNEETANAFFDLEVCIPPEQSYEKAVACWTSLSTNPSLLRNSVITLCRSRSNQDFYIFVANRPVNINEHIRDFNATTMVINISKKDWYFPNLSKIDTLHYDLNKSTFNVQKTQARQRMTNDKFLFYPDRNVGKITPSLLHFPKWHEEQHHQPDSMLTTFEQWGTRPL